MRRRNALAATISFADVRALPAIIGASAASSTSAATSPSIHAQLAEDPRLAALVAARPGLRVAGSVGPLRVCASRGG